MSETHLYALLLSAFLGIVHFFSTKFKPEEGPKHFRIISFAAGISIAYLFGSDPRPITRKYLVKNRPCPFPASRSDLGHSFFNTFGPK